MSWNKLAPIAKTTGRPMASASIVHHKTLPPRIALILAASLKDEFGAPTKADVSAGTGDDLGSLLIEFSDTGAFDIGNFVHGGSRIYLPVPEGVPDAVTINAPCRLGAKVLPSANNKPTTPGEPSDAAPSIIIHLPLQSWAEDVAARSRVASRPAATPPPATPEHPKVGNGEPLDVVAYLTGKGRKVSRLADNRFALDGETVLIGEVLGQVNACRKAAGLDPLSRQQVR